jgi:hypothetical protein
MFQFFSCFIELLVFYETGLMKFWFLIDGFVKNLILVSGLFGNLIFYEMGLMKFLFSVDGFVKNLILVSGLIESLIFDKGSCFILIHM